MKKTVLPLVLGLVLFLFISTVNVEARAGPQAYLREYVSVDYGYDGTPTGEVSRTGQVLVSVPNDDDVLQYINIGLQDYNPNTTIKNANAYKNVVTSYPTVNSTSTIYVNTTASDQATSYVLNDTNAAPTINLSVTWSNQKGGTDLYDSDNIGYTENNLTFNVTITNPSSQKTLSNVNVTIYFAQDTNGANDAVEVTQMVNSLDLGGASRGTMDSWDLDSDGQVDTVNWVGNLDNSGDQKTIYLRFYANITENTNFAGDTHDLDGTSDKGGNANYTSSGSTLSGTSIASKFSRADIRQGVDLSVKGGYWHVRGFIRNMANETGYLDGYALTYNVSYWRVYEVASSTGAPYSTANQTGNFITNPYLTPGDGRVYTTDSSRSSDTSWFNTTAASGSKPFFTVYMDWQVVWDSDSNDFYTGYINTTMNLPELYLLDLTHTKTVSDGYISPDTGGENVTLNDNVTFVGDTNAPAKHVEIYSLIPGKTAADADHGDWDVQVGQETFRLYYVNDTSTKRLNISSDQSIISVSVSDASAGTSGSVNVSVWDFSAALIYGSDDTIGNYMDDDSGSDKLWLTYIVRSSSEMTTGDNYEFNGTVMMTTDTGTPLTEYQDSDYINVSGRRLIGWKQLIAYSPAAPATINASIVLEVQDGTGNGIPGIKFIDYVPNWTMNLSQYQGNVTVQFCESGCSTWVLGTDYNITDNGTRTLPDGTLVHAFEFINASGDGTWNLTDGQFINVTYQMQVSDSGLYMLPTIISAFDPVTGESFGSTVYGIIKVNVPEPSVPLQMAEGDLELAKRIIVGKPALWVKEFDVYNPNPRPVTSRFETVVFNDVMDAQVSYYNEQGEKVDLAVGLSDLDSGRLRFWDDRINALETRPYEVRVLTPPVLEIDRDIEVLEKVEERMVKLKMDVYLKNFAEEGYENIVLNLPIAYQNIYEVRDAFGNPLQFTGGADTSSIIVDKMEPDGLKTVTVIYKESYPTIIITPDRDRYDLNSPVGLEILVINGGDTVDYPYLEVEIYTPGMDVMYSTIEKLETMDPLEKTEMYEKFSIPAYAPGGMYIASAKFREDFVTLASATGNFFVSGNAGVGIPESLQVLLVVIVILILGYFSVKRVREIRSKTISTLGV
jgi:hypothetical protein